MSIFPSRLSSVFPSASSVLVAVAAAQGALFTPAVHAHDTWLAPEQRVVRERSDLGFLLSSGERFPTLGSAIAPQRIDVSGCRQGSESLSLNPGRRRANALRLSTLPRTDESVACWVQLKPRTLDLQPRTVDHYLEEIDAPRSVRDAWSAATAPKRWNETYTKNAKVLLPGAGTKEERSADKAVGLKLELLLMPDDGAAASAGTLAVVALLDGRPREGLSIALTGERGQAVQRLRTDAQGRVVFKAPPGGRWMLSATDLVARDAAVGEWESQFSTLVFEVAGRRRRSSIAVRQSLSMN